MIIIPKRQIWTRQPTEAVDIDWSNTLTRGLAFANPLRPVVGMMDLVQRQFPTTNLTAVKSNHFGLFPYFDAQLKFDKYPVGMGIGVYPPTTIAWTQEFTGDVNSWQTPLSMNPSSGLEFDWSIIQHNGYGIYYRFSAGVRKGGNNATCWDDHGAITNDPVHYALVMPSGFFGDQTSWVLYKNGQELTAKSPTSYGAVYSGEFLLAKTGDGFVGTLGNLQIWTRSVDAGEAEALYENQWQIYKRRSRHVFVGASGVGGDVTLDPTTGGISFSGQAPTITLPVALTPSTGSVVITGQTPAVTNPLALTPTTGSVVLGGNSPSITLPVELTATTGSVTFTGNQPTVEAGGGVSLTSSTGSVTISGNTPTITLPVDVTSITGSVTFSGNQPTLNTGADVILTPTTGSIVFYGQTASITLPVELTPSVGNITLSGNTPTITLPVAITPATGQLVISGNVPVITLGITSTPLTGEIIITGNQPTFSLAVGLTSITGSLAITGNQPTMTGTSTLEDAEFLRQSVFVRSAEAREFARINTSSRYFSRRN